jgi:ubiquinone/menaquinone biosynthesis C-methylase UbiE
VTVDNREIYNRNYSASQLDLVADDAVNQNLIAVRLDYVRRLGAGRDVLDLCCGTGSYLLPNLDQMRSAVAVDFSSTMLDGLRDRLGGSPPPKLTILEEDAGALSVPDASVDFVFSWTSLYYMPDLGRVLDEVKRVLRPGGVAALELGNQWSVNEIVSHVQHRQSGWAKPHHVPYPRLRRMVEDRFDVRDWRSFQLLNSYGTPPRLRLLTPLTSERWAPLLGRRVSDGRTLDERLSSAPPLRPLAFRHIAVVERRADAR